MGEKFRQNKCCTRLDGVVDRISELPDDIIVAILSRLSLREAAATSVLALRWSDLWRHTSNLVFTLSDPNSCKNIETVNSVLQSHKSHSLKEFSIRFYVNKSAKSAVTKWLKFVFSRSVERLEWDFQCPDASDQILLTEVLRKSAICWGCRNLTIFTSLKSLRLRRLRVSGEDIKLFLSVLLSLEVLSICYASLTSHVEVCGATLALKHLEILHCEGGKSVKVSAPNLTWLGVDGISALLLPLNVPKLAGAFFTYTSRASIDNVPHFISAISYCKNQLKTLNLTLCHPKSLFSNAAFPFPQMPNLKKLVVTYTGLYEDDVLPLTAILWASPRLQEFELEFASPGFPYGTDLRNSSRSSHLYLEVFEFRGFCGASHAHIELVEYLSKNCLALQKIILDCPPIFPTTTSFSEVELQMARHCIKSRLQGKISDHIQLLFC